MTKSFDFYFDFISPYSFLAFERFKSLKGNDKIKINYKPILLGGLHKLGGITAPAFNDRKLKHMRNDCELVAKKNSIDYIVCFGGYISLPVGLAAWICRKPLFLHEQNSIIGTSNRILQKFAEILFLGFSINHHVFQNSMLVGNPIKNFNKNSIPNSKKNTLRIYVTGGSQGSDFINKNIPIALNDLDIPIEIKHQCGKGKSFGIKELYSAKISLEVKEFYDSPQDLILWSDFVVSRAGALSLSEAISLKRGLVMIPLPSAIDNHQFFNANQIKSLEMGLVHEEHESIESLSKKIKNLIETKQYLEWSDKDCNIDHFQAARRMVSSIIKF